MAVHDVKYKSHIPFDRLAEINELTRELAQCCLCHGVAWHPVACQTCQTLFCSTCIHAFHQDQSPDICIHPCEAYVERKIPNANRIVLAGLKINCRYKFNGCTEMLLYNELEEHEQRCDYQLRSCDGCQEEIIEKNFDQHQNECQLMSVKCDRCSTFHARKDSHTSVECLQEQFQQQTSKMEQLEKEILDQQTTMNQMQEKIRTNDIFWATFFGITKEKKNMLDKQSEDSRS